MRLNGERVSATSRAVKAGDVVTVALDRTVRIMKVTGFAERRGDADAARVLYEDLTPKPEPSAALPPGVGGAMPVAGARPSRNGVQSTV